EWGHNELAIIYRQMRDYKRATENAHRAIALNPEFFNPYLTLGDIALDEGHPVQAIAYFKKAKAMIRRAPLDATRNLIANIENQIGFAYESMDENEKALEHYRLAM